MKKILTTLSILLILMSCNTSNEKEDNLLLILKDLDGCGCLTKYADIVPFGDEFKIFVSLENSLVYTHKSNDYAALCNNTRFFFNQYGCDIPFNKIGLKLSNPIFKVGDTLFYNDFSFVVGVIDNTGITPVYYDKNNITQSYSEIVLKK